MICRRPELGTSGGTNKEPGHESPAMRLGRRPMTSKTRRSVLKGGAALTGALALERGAVFHQGPAQPLLDDLDYRKKILWL